MAVSNQFLYKPTSQRDGNLVILTPNSLNNKIDVVQILDESGKVVATGTFDGNEDNGQRGHFRFDRPGAQFGGGQVKIIFDDGRESITQDINEDGQRFGQNFTTEGTTTGSAQLLDEKKHVDPRFTDFSGLEAPFVDFMDLLKQANNLGEENKAKFLENFGLSSDLAQQLIDTDIEGIQKGLDAFIPQIREQGDIDQTTNIARAGQLDEFNLDRLPGFNEANREEVAASNRFNQQQQLEAVDAAGLGFRTRIEENIGRLEKRARTGRLGGELDESLSTELANRGSELGAASGISSLSGAGVRANDRLTVNERVNLALGAEAALPGVLMQGQSVLQSTPERAPTLFNQPTAVPLSTSNIADRIPVTANISAGASQQAIAGDITNRQTISPTNALSQSIGVSTFNEKSAFNTELLKLNQEQAQLSAEDAAKQAALNAEKADKIREEQRKAHERGEKTRADAEKWKAVGDTAGAVVESIYGDDDDDKPSGSGSSGGSGSGSSGGGTAGSGSGGTTTSSSTPDDPFVSGGFTGQGTGRTTTENTQAPVSRGSRVAGEQTATRTTTPRHAAVSTAQGNTVNSVNEGIGSISSDAFQPIVQSVSDAFGGGSGTMTMGDTQISTDEYESFVNDTAAFFRDPDSQSTPISEDLTDIDGSTVIHAQSEDDGSVTFTSEDGQTRNITSSSRTSDFMNTITAPMSNRDLDTQIMTESADLLSGWDDNSETENLGQAADITVSVLEDNGTITGDEADDMRSSNDAIQVIMDPDASDAQKFQAAAEAGANINTLDFQGSIDSPTTIEGNTVISQGVNADGEKFFSYADSSGNIENVTQSELELANHTTNALKVFAVLNSSADTETKIASLGSIGVSYAQASGMVESVVAGNVGAGLAVFNTAHNWDDMNDVQRGVSVMQTGLQVFNAANSLLSSGASVLEAFAPGVTDIFSTATTATNTIIESTTNAAASGTASGAASGTASGAASGTASGAASGAGTGAGAGAGVTTEGVVQGVGYALAAYNIYETVSQIKDLPDSAAQKQGAISLGATGAGVGAQMGGPVGAGIGLIVGITSGIIIGSTGSGKGTGQKRRDGWRDSMADNNFATVNENGTHEFKLADGSVYEIGADGDTQLQNVGTNIDGRTERYSFDVDWSNPVAVETIPDAHLFAIATGLDPTSSEGFGLFQRAMTQSLNAATSNVDSVEGVRGNFKSLLDQAGISPAQVGMRIESLRVSNRITEGEYNVYLDRVNKIYGTTFAPTDRNKMVHSIASGLGSVPASELSEGQREYLATITDPRKLAAANKKLQERLDKERGDLDK